MNIDENAHALPAGSGAATAAAGRAERALRAQAELEALRREIERWHVLAGGDRALLEAILHHSPHGIIVCDPVGRFVLQNRASERIWAGSATIHGIDAWGQYRAFHPDGRPFEAGDWSMARCLSRCEIVEAEEVHFQRFDGTHGILLGSCAPILNPAGELAGALSVFADISGLKEVEERLRIITDSLPALISYVDAAQTYRFTNMGHEQWFGRPRTEIEGLHVKEVLGEEAYGALRPHIEMALSGETLRFEETLRFRRDAERHVEASYIPHFGPDRSVLGFIALTSDISERRRLEQARAQWAARTERLLRITAALADAVNPDEVIEAVVDRTAAVLGAGTCALWLLGDDGRTATLARAVGYSEAARTRSERLPLGSGDSPVADALLSGEPLWIESEARLRELYPKLFASEGAARRVTIACLPMTVEGRTIGALAFTFDRDTAPLDEDRSLLLVVAQHCAQALERIRVLRQAQIAYAETELLYRLTDAVNRAQSVAEVYEASLDTISNALGVGRASILFFDGGKVMRFEAWRGLSDEYRAAVDGHSPWKGDEIDPAPIYVEDAAQDGSLESYREIFDKEKIGALAFVPLVYEGRLLGKFMLYWGEARAFSEREHRVARSIADQVASAVGRKRAQQEREKLIEQLSQTVRLNELFAGVVGHDLRNPLSAIMNTAQLALRRDEGEKLFKPLSRILSASERMTRMIEQLLDFTRARVGGGIPLDPQDTDLGSLGRHVLGEVEDANPERSVVVEQTGDLEGFWDADRLAQVLSNLAGNAVQHGAGAAPVLVRFDGSTSDVVVVQVHNDGVVRPEVLPILFEPFRGTELRRDRAKGLGLGLYITQQIVLAHGGEIRVTSSEPEGTTFTVTLPRRAVARAQASAPKGWG